MISQEHALVLEGVTRNFGALRAIEDVSFSVAAGERRAVIGANGAGKTTLFNVITGDFPATEGRVRFFGDDVTLQPPFERIRAGLKFLPPDKLVPAPDCGMKYLPREVAFGKLKALAAGAALVRKELA